MSGHVLGVYWSPQHKAQRSDREYIEVLRPPLVRILDPGLGDIADVHRVAPDALIALRYWTVDDHDGRAVRDLMADPTGTGVRHAREYRSILDSLQQEAQRTGVRIPRADRLVFNAANEPNQGGEPAQIAAYNVAFLDECTRLGLRAAALCLGVGWPASKSSAPKSPVDWRPYVDAGLEQAIKRGGHLLELHEYCYKSGPQDGWRWFCGRHLQCPLDVPILLGEVGIDNYVDAKRWKREDDARGWVGNVGAEQYADMIAYHIRNSDSRVMAALPFITDYRDASSWASFDTRDAHQALLARAHQMKPGVKFGSVAVVLPAQPSPIVVKAGIIPPAVAEAVMNVESGGRAYAADNRLIIRFEAHIFKTQLGNDGLWAQHFRHGSPSWTGQYWRASEQDAWRPIHTGNQADEWAAFECAQSLAGEAASRSISMGAFQIMGFNYARLGYASAEEMRRGLGRGLAVQLLGFVNFVLGDAELLRAMQGRDWRTIARIYNGPGNVDAAAAKYQAAHERIVASG